MPTQQNARDAARLAETAQELMRMVDLMQRKIDELSERQYPRSSVIEGLKMAGII